MIETMYNGRVRTKIDTTANWEAAIDFVPLKGEIIIYSDYSSEEVGGVTYYIPNFKVGDGLAYAVDLPFVSDDLRKTLTGHIDDMTVHVTQADREFWNNKVRCYMNTVQDNDGYLIDGETLIFTTN